MDYSLQLVGQLKFVIGTIYYVLRTYKRFPMYIFSQPWIQNVQY